MRRPCWICDSETPRPPGEIDDAPLRPLRFAPGLDRSDAGRNHHRCSGKGCEQSAIRLYTRSSSRHFIDVGRPPATHGADHAAASQPQPSDDRRPPVLAGYEGERTLSCDRSSAVWRGHRHADGVGPRVVHVKPLVGAAGAFTALPGHRIVRPRRPVDRGADCAQPRHLAARALRHPVEGDVGRWDDPDVVRQLPGAGADLGEGPAAARGDIDPHDRWLRRRWRWWGRRLTATATAGVRLT